MNWYLLQSKPNAHAIACKHLKQQGFQVFLPLMIKTSKRGSKFISRKTPLFPSYLFMGTELKHIPWTSVNSTRGVSKAIALDGNYHPVDSAIIEGIKFRCDQNDVIQIFDQITYGDRVKINRGPFTDFICNVDKIEDSKRAWVLIDILQQKIRTKVKFGDLLRVN